jgi:DNA-directed RNA polymerase subunit E'/Rpb7
MSTLPSKKPLGIYMHNVITRKVQLSIREVGSNIKYNIENKLQTTLEGRCTVEGFIKPGSISLHTYSSGLISGDKVIFEVVFACLICRPVQGMKISRCVVKNNTKAGIRAETKEQVSPVVIFISRDHHHRDQYFNDLKEGDEINVKVIGQRFELNDRFVSIIGELMKPHRSPAKRGKIKILDKSQQSGGKEEVLE